MQGEKKGLHRLSLYSMQFLPKKQECSNSLLSKSKEWEEKER